jgi:hypothetical protein
MRKWCDYSYRCFLSFKDASGFRLCLSLLIIHDCFERWMRRRNELDSKICHVERSETSLVANDRAAGSDNQRFFSRDCGIRMTERHHEAIEHQSSTKPRFPS